MQKRPQNEPPYMFTAEHYEIPTARLLRQGANGTYANLVNYMFTLLLPWYAYLTKTHIHP